MKNNKDPLNFTSSAAKYILYTKLAIGFSLIGIGIYATIMLILIVFRIFTNLESVPFMNKIMELGPSTIEMISFSGKSIYVSNTIMSYVVALLVLMFAGRLTTRILQIGIKLINKLEVKYLFQKLWAEWEKTKKDDKTQENNGAENELITREGKKEKVRFK